MVTTGWIIALMTLTIGLQAVAEDDYWVETMREVHSEFDGQQGYVAQFGDSITNSMAFWKCFEWSNPDEYLSEDGLPKRPAKHTRWRDYIKGAGMKGKKYANFSRWTVKNLLEAVPGVLEREKPEAAIIMIGTNDIKKGTVPPNYKNDLNKIVQLCIDAHCIPIVSTIPPRKGKLDAVKACNAIIKEAAKFNKVPLVDYYNAIIQRREKDWYGTLIEKDGVHPRAIKKMNHVFTEDNLNASGFALRNYVTFLKFREVYFKVLAKQL